MNKQVLPLKEILTSFIIKKGVRGQVFEIFHLKMNKMLPREGDIQFKVSQIYSGKIRTGMQYLSCGI